MQRYFLLGFLLLFQFPLLAQPFTQSILGRIMDNETAAPLAFAEVVVLDLPTILGTQADANGYFRIDAVPIGKRKLGATMLGYEDFLLPNVEVTSGKEVVLEIKMQQKLTSTKEVLITAESNKERPQNEMVTVSGRTFSVEESNRYASGFGDLTRMAQAFAGVASADGTSNNIVIRGNNPQGMLWMLEGIEVSNPNHFPQGDAASGGGISILESNVITSSDFLTGAFPAEYGNALSGVFDVKLRKGNPEKYEHSVQLSTIGLTALSEGPIIPLHSELAKKGTKASYLVKYRYSTLTLMALTGLDFFGSVAPSYQDLTFNLNLSTAKGNNFSFFGVGGWATSGNKAKTDSTKWKTFDDKLNYNAHYGTGILGMKHSFLLKNNQTTFTTHLLYNLSHIDSQGDSLDNTFSEVNIEKIHRTYNTLRFSERMYHKASARSFFKTGIVFSLPMFDVFSQYRLPSGQFQTEYDTKNSATYLQAFISHKYRAGTRWEINSGLHGLYNLLNQHYSIEPRIGTRYKVTESHSLSAAIGFHSKIEPISVYFLNVFNNAGVAGDFNKNLALRKAFHAVLGYDFPFRKDFRLKTEIYYQYLFDVPVAQDSSSDFSLINTYEIKNLLVNKGTGFNYGWEFTLEKFYSHKYYFLFTTSLFSSKYKTFSGKTYNTLYNGNYVVNMTGGKDFTVGKEKNKTLGISSRLLIMGGNRTTPIDTASSRLYGTTIYFPNKTYENRFSPFFRWDFGMYFQVNKKGYSWRLSTDIQNITARKNVVLARYDTRSHSIVYDYGLGFIPTINWKIDF